MPLVSSKQILLQAQAGGYAIAAFNIENMEMAQAVVCAAKELLSPVIIQTTPSSIRFGGIKLFAGIMRALAEDTEVSIALHLDHGESFGMAARAACMGYSSLMIDGSRLDFYENVKLTRSVVEMALELDIPVEGELGAVGGKEDDTVSERPSYTDPSEAVEFVKQTGIFSLAIGIGTAHGIYKGIPMLDLERLTEVARVVPNPLVLHGTSGVPESTVTECIRRGICKVNYATDLRVAFSNGIKEALQNNPDAFDPKLYLGTGRKNVYETAVKRIILCGSQGKQR